MAFLGEKQLSTADKVNRGHWEKRKYMVFGHCVAARIVIILEHVKKTRKQECVEMPECLL